MGMIQSLKLSGWKSIREANVEFGPINILIGANGSGKSNLISFFKFLNELIGGRLQEYVGVSGGSDSILHYGSKRTPNLHATFVFITDRNDKNTYYSRFTHTAHDTLIFTHELLSFQREGFQTAKQTTLTSVYESGLYGDSHRDDMTAKVFRRILSSCRVFHFHDTSKEASLRKSGYIDDNLHLYPDGRNVAAMLYQYRQKEPQVYDRIVSTIRQIYPRFGDFVLEPRVLNPKQIILNWRERGEDILFGPHQLSDGTLRAIAMVTLLLQPEATLPDVIILDEPELGLHPYAIGLLADLLRSVSHRSQVIVSTQSTELLNYFEPEEIIVTDRNDRESSYKRLGKTELDDWLTDYSMGEIWQKNVIGGGPHR
jgi:predicted ATPase